jgi:hypothetical protein
MHEANLVRVHETGVAHHVAAVRQVNRQHRASAMFDGGTTVVVQLLVVVRPNITAEKHLLKMFEERRVHCHHVLEAPVDRAVLDHDDLAVLLKDGGFDLTDLLIQEDGDVLLTVNDRLSRLLRAGRAQRIRFPRPPERRLGLLVRLQERLIGPARRKRGVLLDLIGR